VQGESRNSVHSLRYSGSYDYEITVVVSISLKGYV
jgi:hypothetical protein